MNLYLISFGALLSIMNPLGTVPVFLGLTKDYTKTEKTRAALLASVNVLIILLISFFAGKYLLVAFGISLNSLRIAGGFVIASSGYALLTGKFSEHKGMKRTGVQKDLETRTEIALTPLAIPMLAGPGTISLLITYNQEHAQVADIVALSLAMLSAAIAVGVVLVGSQFIVKALGASGMNALSRIIGFIVIAIGVEYIVTAVLGIFQGGAFMIV